MANEKYLYTIHIKDFVRENLWLQGKLAIKGWKTEGGGWRSVYSCAICANAPKKHHNKYSQQMMR